MISIKNVSLYALTVSIRYCKMNKFPNNMQDWTKEHNDTLNNIAKEVDKRRKK